MASTELVLDGENYVVALYFFKPFNLTLSPIGAKQGGCNACHDVVLIAAPCVMGTREFVIGFASANLADF